MLLLVPLILLVHLILLVNTRFTLWPEMVVYPYLMNNHFSLYGEIITNYPPLFIYFLSFWTRVFGYQPINFQILTYLLIAIIDFLIFMLASKLFGKFAAYFALLFFVILSIPFGINSLWFDLVVTPFILISMFFFSRSLNKPYSKTLFFSVLPLTIAFFIKQQVIWLLIWFVIIFSFRFRKNPKFLFPQVLFSLMPLAIFTVIILFFFYQKNLLNEYIFWIFRFPVSIAPPGAGYHIFPNLRQILIVAALFFLFIPILSKNRNKIHLILAVALILVAFAYRFDFFHLIPALAILSLITGVNFKNLFKINRLSYLPWITSLLILFAFTMRYMISNWHKETRFFESEIYQATKVIQLLTDKNERVYVQNGPDQIFPIANRLPPKPWVDEFPWYLEKRGLEQRVIEGIKQQNPRFVVFKPYDVGPKYALGVYRPQELADYLDENYQNQIQISDTLWLKTKK